MFSEKKVENILSLNRISWGEGRSQHQNTNGKTSHYPIQPKDNKIN